MKPEVEVTLDEVGPDSARIRVTLVLVLVSWKLDDLLTQFGQAVRECARQRLMDLLDDRLLQQKPAVHTVAHIGRGRKAIKKGCRLQDGFYEEIWGLLQVERLNEALKALKAALQGAETYQRVCREKLDHTGQAGEFARLRRSAEKRGWLRTSKIFTISSATSRTTAPPYTASRIPLPDLSGMRVCISGPV